MIIALQRAAATPMELTKQALLQSIEDLGRIFMDFMGAYYGERFVEVPIPRDSMFQPNSPDLPGQEAPRSVVVPFDFSALLSIPCSVELDVGASSYWSEIASMQTLDNLLMNNRISTVEYLKRLPARQLPDREGLIALLERQEAMERQMAGMLPQGGGLAGDAGGGALTDSVPGPEGSAGGGYGTLQRKINETGEIPKER